MPEFRLTLYILGFALSCVALLRWLWAFLRHGNVHAASRFAIIALLVSSFDTVLQIFSSQERIYLFKEWHGIARGIALVFIPLVFWLDTRVKKLDARATFVPVFMVWLLVSAPFFLVNLFVVAITFFLGKI